MDVSLPSSLSFTSSLIPSCCLVKSTSFVQKPSLAPPVLSRYLILPFSSATRFELSPHSSRSIYSVTHLTQPMPLFTPTSPQDAQPGGDTRQVCIACILLAMSRNAICHDGGWWFDLLNPFSAMSLSPPSADESTPGSG